MGFVLPVVALAATVVSAVGSMQAGQTQAAWANYNAQVQRVQAQEAQDQANAQAMIDAQATRRRLGEAASAYAAAGVDMQGSPLAVMSDLATQGELTRRLTLYKGQIGAQALNEQATITQGAGAAAESAAYTRAGSTLLTGATSFAGNPTVQGWFGPSAAGQPLTGPLGPGGLLGHA